jgi:C-terminal processing protease CtpA/Prc
MFEALSFFTHGTIGNLIMRNEIQVPIDIPDQDVKGSSHIPLVVLISPSTASAGALFAGLLQDMGRAYLVGETTFSIEEMGQVFNLPDGSVLVIAVASVQSINHPDLNFMGTGIAPDMGVRTDWNEFMSENDPVIRAALDYLDR